MNNINNDLINRQMAVDALETVKTVKAENGELYIAKINAQMKLEILPSVQPERKVGKWIRDKSWSEGAGMGESYGHYWKCNQCNNIVKGDWSQCGDNFCSNCGADMRGDKYETN